ncbi:hypothetical protein [Fulvivirga sedimenti]|nr:hypothetical protein [Fulvivirga sedimenti]
MRFALTICLLCLSFALMAQKTVVYENDAPPPFRDRIFFGGGVGFNAGNGITAIQVNPIVGYMITPKWSAGIGLEYQYVKYTNINLDDNLWGGQLFTRYNIYRMFFLMAEYDLINYTQFYLDGSESRETIDRVLLGGGISQPLGRSGAINLVALYDFSYDNTGPYGSPWVFRIFFSF